MANFYGYLLIDENKCGVVDNWEECKSIVNKKNSRYKGFPTMEKANEWILQGANYENIIKNKKEYKLIPGYYFDAGKRGVYSSTCLRITDEKGNDFLNSDGFFYEFFQKILVYLQKIYKEISIENQELVKELELKDNWSTNKFYAFDIIKKEMKFVKIKDKHILKLSSHFTNNVGELTSFILACILVIEEKKYLKEKVTILGDSQLVLNYWSKGVRNLKNNLLTNSFIDLAVFFRKYLETKNVQFSYIPGDINPADLGNHVSKKK